MSYSNYGPDWCRAIIEDLEKTGSFEVGIASDKKQRGSAINVDVMDEDAAEGLFVLQVRECRFHPRKFNRVRKNYFLAGRNENGNAFAHPIQVNAKSARVKTALCRIWECTPSQLDYVVRQGDVALIAERGLKKADCEPLPPMDFVIDEDAASTHLFTPGELWARQDRYYVAESIQIRHTKGQHPYVSQRLAKGKLYRVQVGVRARVWSFSRPTAD